MNPVGTHAPRGKSLSLPLGGRSFSILTGKYFPRESYFTLRSAVDRVQIDARS